MNIVTRLLLIACLVLPFAACKKEEVAKVQTAPVAKPATEDVAAWTAYVIDVVKRNADPGSNPYLYFIAGESAPDFQGEYDRQLEKLDGDLGRGVTGDNVVLAFASPASAKMADMVVDAFSRVDPGSWKGAKVLFIGDAADSARVEAAVTPSGVTYKFVEAK
jgi:hypothetical protein